MCEWQPNTTDDRKNNLVAEAKYYYTEQKQTDLGTETKLSIMLLKT